MAATQCVLVIEDDRHISKLIKYNLHTAGFECLVFNSGEEALKSLDQKSVSLVILDIMLPGMDGLEVCRRIRQNKRTENTPILILTAKGEEVDRIVGLELGADDYMVKPFSPRELILRVKSVLKRGGKPEQRANDILVNREVILDISKYEVMVQNKKVILTPMEFKLLKTLMERSGRVQTRENLLNDVWGFSEIVSTRTVDTHVKRLREKLGKSEKLIETVSGVGYRFKEDES